AAAILTRRDAPTGVSASARLRLTKPAAASQPGRPTGAGSPQPEGATPSPPARPAGGPEAGAGRHKCGGARASAVSSYGVSAVQISALSGMSSPEDETRSPVARSMTNRPA